MKLLFDADERIREARRRAFEGIEYKDCKRRYLPNDDYWGDEVYHHMMEFLYVCQVECDISHTKSDAFRPLAARYHGENATQLRKYTLPLERLRSILRLSLCHIFEIPDPALHLLQLDELDDAMKSILRTFVQNADIGINWPMFDSVFHSAPNLLHGLFHVLCLFKQCRNHPEKSLLKRPYEPGKIFTAPILVQLQSVFQHDRDIWFDDFIFPWHHDRKFGRVKATDLMAKIKEMDDDRVIILASGKDAETSERDLVGILIPNPAKDEKRIQPPGPEEDPACCLLYFSCVLYPVAIKGIRGVLHGL